MLKKLFSRRDRDADVEALDPGAEDEAAPAKPREPGGLSIARVSLVAFLASALILVGLALLAYRQVVNQVDALQQQAVAAQGERLAAEIAGRIQGLAAVVENAASKQGLIEAMARGDAAALANRADALASAIPGALRVRFLAAGTNQPDETQFPRLGYAALDLAREAEKGARPPLEVHWFGSPDQHIAVARAIAAPPQAPVGVLLASLDPKLLVGWMKSAVPAGGYAELRQAAGEMQILLASQGDAALQGTPPTATVTVPGAAWELAYWLPTQAGDSSRQTPLGFVALFAAAGVALAAVFFALASVATKLVRGDLIMLVNYMVDLLSRRRDHGYTVRLREFRKAVQMLDDSVACRSAERPAHDARPPSKEPIPEDPLFLQHEDAIVVVEEGPGSAKGEPKG